MLKIALRVVLAVGLGWLGMGESLAGTVDRSITIRNLCGFDVWVNSVGSDAGQIACSASSSSAQANCPANMVCYQKDTNTSYCVAGTATPGTTLPLTQTSQINLVATTCPSGLVDQDTSSNSWGQCLCSQNSDCASGQTCQNATATTKQCFWSYALADGGHLEAKTGTLTVPVQSSSTEPSALVGSGKFVAKLACDQNGNCASDYSKGAPASLAEFTFTNSNDWYDISYINGINLPIAMYPVTSTSNDYQSNDPYRCMPAGADAKTYATIASFLSTKKLSGNTALKDFTCGYGYTTIFAQTNAATAGFNFVTGGGAACSSSTACASGLTCGLSLSSVQSGSQSTSCGNSLGYWTYAQFCAANSTYSNSNLGVNCSVLSNLAYALCANQPNLSDTGPGRSCFNATTTTSGETCCGYASWTNAKGTAQPMGIGDKAVSGVVTQSWTTAILPAVTRVKQGCNLAYSYQYDDPYSTFTCAATAAAGALNTASYNIDLCPSSEQAGIAPPAVPSCTAGVPSGYSANMFTVGAPCPQSGSCYTVSVFQCSGSSCTTPIAPNPSGSTIFPASAGTNTYSIVATNLNGTSQTCKFTIPQDGCISRADTASQCQLWQISTTGAWPNRSVQVPAFN